jgi:hypothetical protein
VIPKVSAILLDLVTEIINKHNSKFAGSHFIEELLSNGDDTIDFHFDSSPLRELIMQNL